MSKLLFGLTVLVLAATPALAQQDRFADPRPIDFTQPWNTDLNKGRPPAPPAAGSVQVFTREDTVPMKPAACPSATGEGAAKAQPPADTEAGVQKPACDVKVAAPTKGQP